MKLKHVYIQGEHEKVWMFKKIQHKCLRIGTKMFKIGGKMAMKYKFIVGDPLLQMGQNLMHCICPIF